MTLFDRFFRRDRLQDDAVEEIAAHIEERTADLVARGMSPADARAEARRAFGNATQLAEQSRAAWAWPFLDSCVADLRLAARQMRRVPAHTMTIVVTLALGIAAAATVLSWAQSVLGDALPGAADANAVYAIETTTASGSPTAASWLDYRDFRDYLTSFDGIAAAFPTSLAMGDETQAERRWGELVSANFFDVLRVRPALGTFFSAPADDAEGAHAAAVISYALWQARWRGDSAVIGSVVRLNGYPFTIIGVAPRAFRGSMPGQEYQVWVPAAMLGQIVPTGGWWLRDRGTRTFRVLARLRPGITLADARRDVSGLAARMSAANRENRDMGGLVLPLWQSHWGLQDALRAPLMLLLGAAALVLVIVCVNTANLLLARAMYRRAELSLRIALGAPRRRLVRQLLTEAALPGIVGTGLGLAGAVSLARSMSRLLPSFASASIAQPTLSPAVVAATCALAVGVMLVAAVLPAWLGLRDAPAESLRDGA
ncbi:MAG TPA: ABC transporter permease, partial [Gemmatimonadaceae bacterium]|nr:ABC transporter permease [Gemmatimonadaceae bacterium]